MNSTFDECRNLEGITRLNDKMILVPNTVVLGYFNTSPKFELIKDRMFHCDTPAVIARYVQLMEQKKLYVVREGEINSHDLEDLMASCKEYVAQSAALADLSDKAVSNAAKVIKDIHAKSIG